MARERSFGGACFSVLACCCAAGCSPVSAQDAVLASTTLTTAPSASELAGVAHALSDDDEGARRSAYQALTTLDEDALPAIAERIALLAHERVDAIEANKILTQFRHAAGSRRADDEVDIAPGVLVTLAERRDPLVVRVAEPLVLMRALEHMGTLAAVSEIGNIVAIDDGLWVPEARHAVTRLGPLAIAAVIEARLHENARTRAWSRWATRELALSSPGTVVQNKSTAVLADILRAWGRTVDFDAMRVVISYVGSEQSDVRDAARWTTEHYGRNGVWQLRQAYENVTGHEPEASWGWRKVMTELFRAHDEARIGSLRVMLDEGFAAMQRGDLATMQQKLDLALAREPRVDRAADVANAYALLGNAATEHRDFARAQSAFTRALALAPSSPNAREWTAALAYALAELRLSRGVVDLPQYSHALALSPDHSAARAAYDRLSGADATRETRIRKTVALVGAALLLVLGMLLARRTKRTAPEPAESEADATLREPTLA